MVLVFRTDEHLASLVLICGGFGFVVLNVARVHRGPWLMLLLLARLFIQSGATTTCIYLPHYTCDE